MVSRVIYSVIDDGRNILLATYFLETMPLLMSEGILVCKELVLLFPLLLWRH